MVSNLDILKKNQAGKNSKRKKKLNDSIKEKTQGFGKLIIAEIPKFVVMDIKLENILFLKLEGKTNKTQGNTRNFRKPLKTQAKNILLVFNIGISASKIE